MKQTVIGMMLLVSLLLTGCASFLERSYGTSEPHSSRLWEDDAAGTLRAESYQDLVNDLLLLISSGAPEGTIRFYAGDKVEDVQTTIEEACHEAQFETPWGSYAVDYITYTVQDDVSGAGMIHVEIGYRRSLEQMSAVVHASSISALHNLLSAAVENGAEELAIQVGYFQGQTEEVSQIVEQMRQEHSVTTPWQIHYYPNETDVGIIEIVLSE